jgi:prolyl-tRNA synthetase
MALLMSRMFPDTKRENPADAEVPSHAALVRAGYVRRVTPGIYTFLPLGLRVIRKIEQIVREEMDRIGAEELRFPALLPREPYETTGRWSEYGDNLFRLTDRRDNDMLLGPTHEEMFALLAKDEISSYRALPKSLYQIGIKYRDEARPRSGVLRGREFVMKDSYSFDIDDAGLAESYRLHRVAYERVFSRLEVEFRIVKAMSGAMGGSASEEFLAPSPIGEDTFVSCPKCDYVANVEAMDFVFPSTPIDPAAFGPAEVKHTPKTTTIETLVAHAVAEGRDITAADTIKSLLFWAGDTPIVAVIPGDRELSEDKLESFLGGVAVKPFSEEDFKSHPELAKGYISPAAGAPFGARVIGDPRLQAHQSWVTGADQADHHAFGVVLGRDFDIAEWAVITDGIVGDPCPVCGALVEGQRGIEIGHIFQLGRKYTDAIEWDVQGPDGQMIRPTMGSYGIGVTRMIAVIAEQTLDDAGLCWPRSVSPADVHVVSVNKDPSAALAVVETLENSGLSVILDERERVSFGVKAKDAELIGVPKIIVVGRDAVNGQVELRDRKTGSNEVINIADLVDLLA